MVRVSSKFIGVMLLGGCFYTASTAWAADTTEPSAESNGVLVTEFRGRPPYKRRFFSNDEIADLARLEEASPKVTGDSVRVVTYRGRPPFKREIESVEEIAELARFEESSSNDGDRKTRRGPPGKPGARR